MYREELPLRARNRQKRSTARRSGCCPLQIRSTPCRRSHRSDGQQSDLDRDAPNIAFRRGVSRSIVSCRSAPDGLTSGVVIVNLCFSRTIFHSFGVRIRLPRLYPLRSLFHHSVSGQTECSFHRSDTPVPSSSSERRIRNRPQNIIRQNRSTPSRHRNIPVFCD